MRLFVALDLPADARLSLAEWRDRALAGREGIRPVAAEALHVTLAFLGYRPHGDLVRVAEVTAGAADGLPAPTLRPVGVVPVPARRARLLALDLEDGRGGAAAVQAAVGAALASAGLYRPESRPFWPHLTLARARRGVAAGPPPASPGPPVERFECTDVTLYRSTLRRDGAVYEALARTRLQASGDG